MTEGTAELVAAARDGDEDAFARLVAPHRGELHALCYRMLGSVHDTEDALQEALLGAWRGLARLDGRSSSRRRLHAITSLPAVTWIDPYPDDQLDVPDGRATSEARYEHRESLELAFVAALQHLPARQRARRSADERLPQRSQQATLRALGDDGLRDVVERFVDAFERGDLDAILDLLADGVVFAMPPWGGWYRGREVVGASWLMPGGPPPRLRHVHTRANGQIALGTYALDPAHGVSLPVALDVLTLRADGREITEVLASRDTAHFARFGLPPIVRG